VHTSLQAVSEGCWIAFLLPLALFLTLMLLKMG